MFDEKQVPDKYDDPSLVARYLEYAFGYSLRRGEQLFGNGTSEALYRTVSDVVRGELLAKPRQGPVVVDFACGVGRTLRDIASVCPGADVYGFDLSVEMANTAARVCSGQSVLAGCPDDGYPLHELSFSELSNVTVVQANAAHPPLLRSVASAGVDISIISMLIDRLRSPAEVQAVLEAVVSVTAKWGLIVLTTPFNWISSSCWREFGYSGRWLLDFFGDADVSIECAFDGLAYREALDPAGAALELRVTTIVGRRL